MDQPQNPDEKPISGTGGGYNIDDLPIGGKGGGYNLDDLPVGGKSAQPFDEQPIGGKGGGYNLDDIPIGGKGGGYNLDDLPVGSAPNDTQKPDVEMKDESKPEVVEEVKEVQEVKEVKEDKEEPQIIKNDAPPNPIDEMPIGGKGGGYNLDDIPIGGKGGGYNLDDIPIGGKGGGYNLDDLPVGDKKAQAFDEQPIGGKGGGYNLDDIPIGGKGGGYNLDDLPVGDKKAQAFDEQPIGGKGGSYNLDEIPIGGKGGGYNLDDLPVGGTGKPAQSLDEQPVGVKKAQPFDEQPIGAKTNPSNDMTEEPISTKPQAPAKTDEEELLNMNAPTKPLGKKPVLGQRPKPTAKPTPTTTPAEEAPINAGSGTTNAKPDAPGEEESTVEVPKVVYNLDAMEGAFEQVEDPEANLPLPQRLTSKNNNTRTQAYKDFKKLCDESPENCSSEIFTEQASKWPTYLEEKMPAALEQAVSAFQAYLKKVKPSIFKSDHMKAVLKNLCEKGISAAKPNIKNVALESGILMFEITECFEREIFDSLSAICSDKKVPVQTAGITLLAQLIIGFGTKKVPWKDFQPLMLKAVNATQPALKKEGMNCYQGLYLYMGDIVFDIMEGVKEILIKSAKTDFPKYKEQNPNFRRGKNSGPVASDNKEESKEAAINLDEMGDDFDPYELAKPVDILKDFNTAYCDKFAACKNWSEKVELLEQLQKACDVLKLKDGVYIELVEQMKKLFKDGHATVIYQSIRTVAALAKGLRERFSSYAKDLFPVLMPLHKDKRNVTDIQTAYMNFLMGTSLKTFVEPLEAGFKDKLPQVRTGAVTFAHAAVLVTFIDDLVEIKANMIRMGMLFVEEKDTKLRDQGLELLGLLKARLGDSALEKALEGMIPQKKAKIDKIAETYTKTKYDVSQKGNGKKTASKTGPGDDVVMKDMSGPAKKPAHQTIEVMDTEAQKPKSSGPPRAFGQKPVPKTPAPTTAKAPGPTKAPGPVSVQEENLGEGLSKEEAIEKFEAFYSEEIVADYNNAVWKPKSVAFQAIVEAIAELKPDPTIIEATAKVVKVNMKDWKESNMALMKEAVNILVAMATHCERVPKRAVATYAPFLIEKIGDMKVMTQIKEVLLQLTDLVTPKFIANQIAKYGSQTKAPKNMEHSCLMLVTLLEEWGGARMPVKECIDFGVLAAASANGQVRTAANKMFCELYKHLGDAIRNFFGDIKESTLKVIEGEISKVTPYKKGEFQSARVPKGDAAEEFQEAKGGSDNILDSLPRTDISKSLSSKLYEKFKSKDPNVRKDTAMEVLAILEEAKMRIETTGIKDLMQCFKEGMKEANKAVLRTNIQVLGSIALAVGPKIKAWLKICYEPMVWLLSDKMTLVRQDVVASMDKLAEALDGSHQIINIICVELEKENPEYREEGFKWIFMNIEGLKQCNHEAMVKPLVTCLCDKKADKRQQSQQLCEMVMGHIGYSPFQKELAKMKPAVQQSVKPLLEKAKANAVSQAPVVAKPQEEKKETPKPTETLKVPASTGPTLKSGSKPVLSRGVSPNYPGDSGNQKPPTSPRKTPEKESPVAPAQQPTTPQVMPTAPMRQPQLPTPSNAGGGGSLLLGANKQRPATSRAAAAPQISLPEPEEIVVNPGDKTKRYQLDLKSRWTHDDIKPETVAKVKKKCEEMFGKDFSDKMFSTDFKKHAIVLVTFQDWIEKQPVVLIDVIDVIFKWSAIKLAESKNVNFMSNLFNFFTLTQDLMIKMEHQLWDTEAYIFVPLICEQIGINNAIMKKQAKDILMKCFEIHSKKQCCTMIMKFGVGAKNLKTVSESLDCMALYIRTQGINEVTEKDCQNVAKLADSSDKAVRETSLVFLEEVFTRVGENIWRLVGNVTLKVRGLLEQRFKHSMGGSFSSKDPMTTSIPKGLNQTLNQTPKKGAGYGTSAMNRSLMQGNVAKGQTGIGSRAKAAGTGSLNKSISQFNSSFSSNNQPAVGKQMPATPGPGSASKKLGGGIGSGSKKTLFGGGASPNGEKSAPEQDMTTRQTALTTMNKTAPASGGFFQQEVEQQQPIRNTEVVSHQHEGGVGQSPQHIDGDEDQKPQISVSQLQATKSYVEPVAPVQPKKSAQDEAFEKLDKSSKEQVNNIQNQISQLISGDLSHRVDALVALNEAITAIQLNEKAVVFCANDMCSAFTHVLVDIFERPFSDIPLRFAKYFVTIVNKTAQQKVIMQDVQEQVVHELTEQLLMRLLIDKLDQLGDAKEGDLIVKNLNAAMLRLLDNCNPNYIFCVLFKLLKQYRDYEPLPKLPGLIIKCLLKLSKIMEKVPAQLEAEKIILVMHEYLSIIDYDNKTQNDDLSVRIVKTVLNELVKFKGEAIWEDYRVVQENPVADSNIQKWISIILKQSQPSGANQAQQNFDPNVNTPATDTRRTEVLPTFGGGAASQPVARQTVATTSEIQQIIEQLHQTEKFDQAIVKLYNYMQRNPQQTLDQTLQGSSTKFVQIIKQQYETHVNSLTYNPDAGSTPTNRQANDNFDAEAQPIQNRGSAQPPKPVNKFAPKSSSNMSALSGAASERNSLPVGSGIAPRQFNRATVGNNDAGQAASTAGAVSTNNDSSADKSNKMQDMRARFQAAKNATTPRSSLGQAGAPLGGQAAFAKTNSALTKTPQSITTSQKNLNASLGQKWLLAKQQAQDPNLGKSNELGASNDRYTMPGGTGEPKPQTALQMNTSGNRFTTSQRPATANDGSTPAKATNEDLQSKLAAVKAKFASMHKKD